MNYNSSDIAIRFNSFSSLLKFAGELFQKIGGRLAPIDDQTMIIPKRYLEDENLSSIFKGKSFEIIEDISKIDNHHRGQERVMTEEEEIEAVRRATDKLKEQHYEYNKR